MARSLSVIGEAFMVPESTAQAEQMLSSSAIISSKLADITSQLPTLHLLGGKNYILYSSNGSLVIYRKIGDNERHVQNFEYFTQQSTKLQYKKEQILKDPRIQILEEYLLDADLQFQ
jgi:hypothetical protein